MPATRALPAAAMGILGSQLCGQPVPRGARSLQRIQEGPVHSVSSLTALPGLGCPKAGTGTAPAANAREPGHVGTQGPQTSRQLGCPLGRHRPISTGRAHGRVPTAASFAAEGRPPTGTFLRASPTGEVRDNPFPLGLNFIQWIPLQPTELNATANAGCFSPQEDRAMLKAHRAQRPCSPSLYQDEAWISGQSGPRPGSHAENPRGAPCGRGGLNKSPLQETARWD